jgi:hypothetical protein
VLPVVLRDSSRPLRFSPFAPCPFFFSNPGLKRRFRTEIIWEDYTVELVAIFRQSLSRVQCEITPDLEIALMNLFSQWYQRRDQNFGNAGLVENLFNLMDELRSKRVIEQNLDRVKEPFQIVDLPAQYRQDGRKNEEPLQELLQELDKMIGLHSVKQTIREMINTQISNQRGKRECKLKRK